MYAYLGIDQYIPTAVALSTDVETCDEMGGNITTIHRHSAMLGPMLQIPIFINVSRTQTN
jgi:hypothetical protein